MDALEEYRKPRNALLVLVADYVSICTRRVEEIRKILPPRFVIPDLLNDISIIVSTERGGLRNVIILYIDFYKQML